MTSKTNSYIVTVRYGNWFDTLTVKGNSYADAISNAKALVRNQHGDTAPYKDFLYEVSKIDTKA